MTWASGASPADGLDAWLKPWQLPFWVLGMSLGALATRLDRYGSLKPLLSSYWTEPSGWIEPLLAGPTQLGDMIGAELGPAPPEGRTWLSFSWKWLISDLESKDWLVARYPEWLRPEGEPERSLVQLGLVWSVASVVVRERPAIAWWSLSPRDAEAFAKRLNQDTGLRQRVADAIGVTVERFDETAPEIIKTSRGWGDRFFNPERIANTLSTGKLS